MPRKQNNTTETAECHGTQHCKRERQQNAKETEQYNRDSRMSRNTTLQERETAECQGNRTIQQRQYKICGEAGTCSLQVHNVQAMQACGH
ncbi:hypothetical protein BDL97_02G145000 [Sphagnum fallax]|nr:hypothetical protein BDL97_02G145000 [Sphagnum fallax]